MEVWEGPQWFPVISKDTTLTPLPSHMQILQILVTLSWGFKVPGIPSLLAQRMGSSLNPSSCSLSFRGRLELSAEQSPVKGLRADVHDNVRMLGAS